MELDQPAQHGQMLNENHQRRLRITFEYIDRLLGEVENMVEANASRAAFPRYSSDFTVTEQSLLREQVSLIRLRLTVLLDSHGIPRGADRISARRAVQVSLDYMDVAAEELGAHYMRGYGYLDPQAAARLDGISTELRVILGSLGRVLSAPAAALGETHGQDIERMPPQGPPDIRRGKA